MGKIVNVPASCWVKDILDDIFWIDPRYEISLQRVPKGDMDFFLKGNIVHKKLHILGCCSSLFKYVG